IPEYGIEADALDSEVARFENALAEARTQLESIRTQIPASAPDEIGAFIETHLLMIQDSALTETVAALIREHHCNAERSLRWQQGPLTADFDQMDDSCLRSGRDDVVHVTARIQRILLKQERHIEPATDADGPSPVIIADELTPADVILLHQQGVAG